MDSSGERAGENERTPEHVIDGRFREGVLAVALHEEVGGAVDARSGITVAKASPVLVGKRPPQSSFVVLPMACRPMNLSARLR